MSGVVKCRVTFVKFHLLHLKQALNISFGECCNIFY